MEAVTVNISYNSFLKSYGLLFLLTCFGFCCYEVIKSFRGVYTPVLLAVFFSLSVNETLSRYKGKKIKVHRALRWASVELADILQVMEDTMLGRFSKTCIKSILIHYIIGISIWNDHSIQITFFKLYILFQTTRLLLNGLARRKFYIEFKPMYLIICIIITPIVLNLFLLPRIYKEILMLVSLAKTMAKKYNIPIGKIVESKIRETLTHFKPIETLLSTCDGEESKGFLKTFPSLFKPKTAKCLAKSRFCIWDFKDIFQRIYDWYKLQSEMVNKLATKCLPIILNNLSIVISYINGFFIFLSTFVSLSLVKHDFLWYIHQFIEPLDPDGQITNTIRSIIRTVVFGGLLKIFNNLTVLIIIGYLFHLDIYCIPSILISATSILHPQLFKILLFTFFGYVAYSKSVIAGFLGIILFYGIKRYIKRHIFSRQTSRFPLQKFVLGILKYGPVGAFLWPLVNGLPWPIYEVVIANQSKR
jgi:hypothetical protein